MLWHIGYFARYYWYRIENNGNNPVVKYIRSGSFISSCHVNDLYTKHILHNVIKRIL